LAAAEGTNAAPNDSSDNEYTDQLLQFLWLATRTLADLPIWNTASKAIKADALKFFDIPNEEGKKKHSAAFNLNSEDESNDGSPPKRQTKNQYSHGELLDIIKISTAQFSNQSMASNKNYDKLPEPIKDILCRLNTAPGKPVSTIPTNAARAFYNCTTHNAAGIYLHNLLMCKDLQGKLSNGDCSFLKSSGLLWSDPASPLGMTVFGIQLTPNNNMSKQLALSIRAKTTSRLEESDNFLLESHRQLPTNCYEYKDLLITYEALWSCFSCADCWITKTIGKFIKHSKEHTQVYQSIFRDTTMDMTCMLYSLDNQIQLYLQDMQRYEWSEVQHNSFILALDRTLSSFTSCQFSINLPTSLIKVIAPKKVVEKAKDSQSSNTSNKGKDAKSKKKDTGEEIPNTKQIADWIIPSSKKFGRVFDRNKMYKLRNENKFPSNGDKHFCLKFHAVGTCARGTCSNDHTPSKDLPQETQKAAHTFFKYMYA
jgi:hypothetical protein